MATRLYKTVKPSGGDYTSLEACLHANEQDLVSNDKYFDVEIDGDWSGGADTTAVTIHNYTTDSTHYVNIYTTSTARHDGKWNTGKYRLITTASSNTLTIASNYVTINGLQIQLNVDVNNYHAIYFAGYDNILICNNIVRGNAYNRYKYGIRNDNNGSANKIYNNIIYDFDNSTHSTAYGCYLSAGFGQRIKLYNNSIIDCAIGVFDANADRVTAKNNLIKCIDAFTGTLTDDDTYNDYNAISENNSGEVAIGSHGRYNQTFTFVNEASDDFHLASTDAGAKDYGLSDPGSGLFSTDIDGQTRSGSWDIGADEYVASGTIVPLIMETYRRRRV